MALQDRLERGQSPEEAKAAVRKEFGNVGLVKEVTRNITGSPVWDGIGKDLRYACRNLIKDSGFSIVTILALALGIGANAAIYGVVHSVLLSPPPFPHSERLVRLWDSFGTPGNYAPVSYPNFRDWRAWNHSFTDIAVYAGASYTLTGSGEAAHLEGVICSASLFSAGKFHMTRFRPPCLTIDRPDRCGLRLQQIDRARGYHPHLQAQE
jgi:MacB-like periplasmic core domain